MALETVRLSAIVGIGSGASSGDQLGSYRLLDSVGVGAYAVVYRARHQVMGVERAIKVLRRSVAACPRERERFLREAQVAARLRHPNVVSVYDCGISADGTPYIVMEHVAGRNLACRLREGVPAAAETLRIAGQVGDALDHAHSMGVVHRDVKPANVLLGDDGTVRLGDFGIAQLGSDPRRLEAFAGVGTPAYMAPEQCLGGRGALGPHTDVYALAAVLYEMLTGRPPHGDAGTDVARLLHAGPPPAPCQVNPYLPAAVDQALERGLARDPAERPPGAGILVAELAAAIGSATVPGAASPEAVGERPTAAPPLPRPAAAARPAEPAARPWPGRVVARLSARCRA